MTNARGKLRFDASNFICSPSLHADDIRRSPRKKQKRDDADMVVRWQAAVACMLLENEDENDGLPNVGLAYSAGSFYAFGPKVNETRAKEVVKSKGKGKGRLKQRSPPRSSDSISTFPVLPSSPTRQSPPPCDGLLTIPGELVLAREKKNGSLYWPAKLLEYIPPTRATKKMGNYLVVYLDETQKAIPRDWFFTSSEDGFGSCRVGRILL